MRQLYVEYVAAVASESFGNREFTHREATVSWKVKKPDFQDWEHGSWVDIASRLATGWDARGQEIQNRIKGSNRHEAKYRRNHELHFFSSGRVSGSREPAAMRFDSRSVHVVPKDAVLEVSDHISGGRALGCAADATATTCMAATV